MNDNSRYQLTVFYKAKRASNRSCRPIAPPRLRGSRELGSLAGRTKLR